MLKSKRNYKHMRDRYEEAALIDTFESRTMDPGSGCELIEMLAKEYERALKKAGFDPGNIYKTGKGTWKVSAPIQVHRTKRIDVLRTLYEHYYRGSSITLKDVYELAIIEYGKLVENGHREYNTLEHYTNAWKKYIAGSGLPEKKISEIKHKDLFDFFSAITANQAITRSTLRNVKTTVIYCFDYAVQNDYIDVNPVLSVKTDKLVCAPEENHDGYTPAEAQALRSVMEGVNSPYARILRLDTHLTVRIGELEAINWCDIDWDKRRVYIHAQIVEKKINGKRKRVYVPYTKSNKYGKGKGRRWLKLNSKAIEVLKEQRKANPFGEFVFVSKNGTPLRTNNINEHLKDYCQKAGIRYLSSHSIRVTNITSLFDNGVAPTKIQVAAGHSDIRTTNGYCRSDICDEIDESILERAL